ncbi:Intraflagellar transport protein 56 [Perkinsus olseni]|uniref:Intraflagellar transport protein 56 n=1 Tax=Perkinsus olseni TaxID=32597 RepID=A0A7J6PU38_PEROL|nr:Intraflagellar transport protein 56 [Perkinsus olseni]
MIRPGSGVNRRRPSAAAATTTTGSSSTAAAPRVTPSKGRRPHSVKPGLIDFLYKRDYTGAIALLEFEEAVGDRRPALPLWLALCYFHNGQYDKAIEVYDAVLVDGGEPHLSTAARHKEEETVALWKACCLYGACEYEQCYQLADSIGDYARDDQALSQLRTRLLLHAAHKLNDEAAMMKSHQRLTKGDSSASSPSTQHQQQQLTLAAIQYLRNHYQQATDIYKKLIVDNPDYKALNVYLALCYYKMDFYDVAAEMLQPYLAAHPTSVIANNLKACCHYQLYNGKAAEDVWKPLAEHSAQHGPRVYDHHDILRHNKVVFRNGDGALQVLPQLLDIIPEARLNLIIYHLRAPNGDPQEAFNLLKGVEPSQPREHILKAVVYAVVGQQQQGDGAGARESLQTAEQVFHLVGASASECDTIPGRQCMASCLYLRKQFEDALVYLKSIKAYFSADDDFNWNYGIACAAIGDYKEGQQALISVHNPKYRSEFTYLSWLCRCLVLNGDPVSAWEVYTRQEPTSDTFNLLHIIANDCYKQGNFFIACKAFDVLERLDPDPEFWDAKRGSAVGVFQLVIAGMAPPEQLQEVADLLRGTREHQIPQVEYIINRVFKKWAGDNGVYLE